VTAVEWVETTGKTVEAAKEAALDQLGVDEDDAEFEIIASPRPGLFGFTRGEARVRARVRPTRPRPKIDRRDRRRRRGPRGDAETAGERAGAGVEQPAAATAARGGETGEAAGRRGGDRRRPRRRGGGARDHAPPPVGHGDEEAAVTTALSPGEQAAIVGEFLEGLLRAFGLEGTVSEGEIDDETLEVRIDGSDLGLLIGPRGQTLQAVQELSRAAVQRRLAGGREARIRVDVAGYRQRRREALERFARTQADEVLATGVARALEPMNPPDRKVVHDAVNELDGVGTISEGEEPYRRVVIVPRPVEAGPADDDVAAPA
jgi:spoIIIJ-associated protein